MTVTVNGEEYKVEMEKPAEPEKKKPVLGKRATAESAEKSENADSAKPVNKNNAVKAPLPGVITDILVSVGDEVKVGDTVSVGQIVCIVEAMKLMNEIESEVSGRITQICVEDGQSVEYGQVLMYVE